LLYSNFTENFASISLILMPATRHRWTNTLNVKPHTWNLDHFWLKYHFPIKLFQQKFNYTLFLIISIREMVIKCTKFEITISLWSWSWSI
jgi:hypothetical protein